MLFNGDPDRILICQLSIRAKLLSEFYHIVILNPSQRNLQKWCLLCFDLTLQQQHLHKQAFQKVIMLLYLLYLCFIPFHCFSLFFMLNWIGIDWSPGSSGLPWSSSMASHTCFSTPWTNTSDTSYIVYIVYIVLPNLQHRRQPTITPSPAPGSPWHALGPEWHSTRHPARLLLWSHVEP